MRETMALVRAKWLTAASYKVQMVGSTAALIVGLVPLFFVTEALQPVMADSIRDQGGEYFAFLILGLVAYSFIGTAVDALPDALSSGITTGTLESLLATPARLVHILAGLTGFRFAWTGARAVLVVLAAVLLGVDLVWSRLLPAAGIMGLVVLAHVPFGLMAGALILAFRTSYPLSEGVLFLSAMLGGVYYPTRVIPDWIQGVSDFIPLTYGLRAARRVLLEGWSTGQVAGDVLILAAFALGLTVIGAAGFLLALRHARRAGTLAQY